MKKRFFVSLLAGVLCLSAMTVSALAAESTQTETVTVVGQSVCIEDPELPGSEELFAGYADKVFYPEWQFSTFGTAARASLTTGEKALYDYLKGQIEKVAAGTLSGTRFTIPDATLNANFQTTFTYAELGLQSGTNLSTAKAAAEKAFNAQFDGDVVYALLHDCPYELYWFDKSGGGYRRGFSVTYDGYSYFTFSNLSFSFSVGSAYAASGDYAANTAVTSAASTAAAKANSIVTKHASKADAAKLTAYRDEICALVSYDTTAAENGSAVAGIDPWQMIYVFDGDASTNVVCEGYSKAFQYLCDKSTFSGDTACYTATGVMATSEGQGGHMWNIVSIGGKNYMADITNSDVGSGGQYGGLFLSGYDSGSPENGYWFQVSGGSVGYGYDSATTALFEEDGILILSSSDYVAPAAPSVTAQPADVSVAEGKTAVFTVTASGTGLNYQWQYRTSPSGSWANATAAGNKTATLSVPATADRNGYQYRCVISNDGGSVNSNAATLTVEAAMAAPVITAQPQAVSATAGSTATFTVKASGTALKYQWQFKAPNYGWQNNSCTTATFSVPATTGRNGYQYRCIVKNEGGSVTSSAVTLTVKAAVAAPVITTQPKAVTAAVGSTAKFTVAASGTGLSYQWQFKAPGYDWQNNTCKTAAFSVPATAGRNNYQYRCIVKNAGGSVTSNAVTLTVTADKPAITTQPKSVTVTADSTAKFTVAASGTALKYQWQYRTSSAGSWASATASGNQTATLNLGTAGTARDGYQYRCKVTNSGGTVYSSVVTLYIKPKITTQPTGVTANAGATAKFTVKATGAGLKYQWQFKAPGYDWKNNSCTTATFSVSATAGRDGYQYRCVVTGKSGKSTTSNAVTLTVKSAVTAPVITAQPKDVTTSADGTAKFTVTASGTGLSYQWQYKAPGYSWKSNSCTKATLTISPAEDWRDGYQYRCIVKNTAGSVTSGTALLTVE